jgi:phosphatidylglycerophosphate synthase
MCKKSKFLIVNSLTLFRLIVSFIFILKNDYNSFDLIILLVILSTDFFDGYLARKLNSATVFGKEFDQITDKTSFYLLYGKLIFLKIYIPYFLILFIIRDITLNYFRYKKQYNFITRTKIINKLKTTLQFIIILLGFYSYVYKINLEPFLLYLIIITVFFSFFPIFKILVYEFKKMDR